MKSKSNGFSSNAFLMPNREPSDLVLTVAGNIIKHLGVQMYSGRPVPAIAELISNAWDADAESVTVKIPLDEAWDTNNDKQVIEVSDNGNGMSWDMVKAAYLNVGRDRRKADNTDKSIGGRRLQGRKGVGKLAGFGIADTLEIQTVHIENDLHLGKKALIWFKLDLSDLTKKSEGPAPVAVIYAGPIDSAPAGGRKDKGTTVTLRHLHERKARNSSDFLISMARRFLLADSDFNVSILIWPLFDLIFHLSIVMMRRTGHQPHGNTF